MVKKHSTNIHNASSDNLWVQVNKSTDLVKVGDTKKFDTNYGEMKIEFGKSRRCLDYVVSDPKITHNQTVASHNSYIIKEQSSGETKQFRFVEAMYGTTSQENKNGVAILAVLKEK